MACHKELEGSPPKMLDGGITFVAVLKFGAAFQREDNTLKKHNEQVHGQGKSSYCYNINMVMLINNEVKYGCF